MTICIHIIYCSTSVEKSRKTEDSEGRVEEKPYISTSNNVTSGGTQNCEKASLFWGISVEWKWETEKRAF
jgi:hypothetical protein